ncbi:MULTISPECIES: 50S ribosomal protein L19 [Francisella]|uniref:Large ribosomal subunit protein bL19 n=1 Tax=Francisella opportunistica TaxID=2016517 RepID=A0A345JT22_9GAMM|nr:MULTISPECIES: 50S ribosomal protein L19 [Francisella]APC92258.1 LSU ribosomal protein L19p [Francisella sp. MA067296]AXH30468.1 50S ribosomal protein L19 [Francisella opportunistica]AXH32109.1 50S ribosomal protein L19 [Francisella opportunistica]AXH33757.1 50S ribosomal protein L19 [Francisella opportunistica]
MKNKFVELVEKSQLRTDLPEFNPGDSITVNLWIKEGDKQRIQAFKGFVLRKRNRGLHSAFTVRKMSSGMGVERTFQAHSPLIDSIIVEKRADVRRAKLYYMRGLTGKAARIKEKV